jgi:hypothetical protein
MRAKLVSIARPSRFEWVIVSRWGSNGEHLSLGWTRRPAVPGEAPIGLTPTQTSFAVLQPDASASPETFQLSRTLPANLTVAGDFMPAEGYVRLSGQGVQLRLRSKGHCLRSDLRAPLQLAATRVRWIGEFFEPHPAQ